MSTLTLKHASKSEQNARPVPNKGDRWCFVGSGGGKANKVFRLFDIVDERKRNAGGGVLAVRGNTDKSER
jgi:hypothetical protein